MRNASLKTGFQGLAAALMCVAFCGDAVFSKALAQEADQAPAQAAPAKGKAKKAKPAAASGPQPADAAAAPAAKDPAVALAAYTAGVKSYQAGKFDAAVQSLNGAVQGGGLSSAQMAKALYYRGAAFQQLGKSGQAISDLTSALWFKNGLDDAERAEATKHRAAAYRDAGLSDQGQPAPTQQVAETGSLAIGTGSTIASPGPSLNALPTGQSSETPSPLGGIGNLFGNLFGGSSTSQPAAPQPSPAQAAAVTAPPLPVAVSPTGAPEVLPWANKTASVGTSATDAALPAPPAPAKPKAVKAATYRIQVAAVKTRDEASAVISKLQSAGGDLAATPSAVDETTIGNMGKFFRVRLGPFADVASTKAPCAALKANGLDCLVTTK